MLTSGIGAKVKVRVRSPHIVWVVLGWERKGTHPRGPSKRTSYLLMRISAGMRPSTFFLVRSWKRLIEVGMEGIESRSVCPNFVHRGHKQNNQSHGENNTPARADTDNHTHARESRHRQSHTAPLFFRNCKMSTPVVDEQAEGTVRRKRCDSR